MGFDKRLLYEVARRYYELAITQEEIALSLGISRSQVSRAIKQARDEGMVIIKVIGPGLDFTDIQAEMCARFGLREAVVISGEGGPSQMLTQNLGVAGARYVVESLEPGTVIGVSWGATLRELAVALVDARGAARDVVVIPLLGGLGQASADLQVNDIASRVASALGGTHHYLHAPSFVDTPEARATIMADSNIKTVADMWATVDMAVVGIGCLMRPSTLIEEGGFPESDLELLERKGTVGDMCMRFFNSKGEPVDTSLDERIIGVGLEQLRRIKCVVAVSGGVNKARAILGALRTGVVDVLVTDDITARKVLDAAQQGQ